MNETSLKPVADMVAQLKETTSETFFNSYVSFIKATEITGKNKSIISRDTKSGKLPHQVSVTGKKQYKVSDLQIIYGLATPNKPVANMVAQPEETTNESLVNSVELATLKERLRSYEELLRVKDAQINDLQENRDKLLDQNNRLTLLLPAPTQESKATIALQPEKKKPWWWIFSD
jgi:hypothetical protein